MLTHQEIFDKAVRAVIAQGKQCLDANGKCKYYTSEGLRCAIGLLLPPDVAKRWARTGVPSIWALFAAYDEALEEAEDELAAVEPNLLAAVGPDLHAAGIPTDEDTLELLTAIQRAHDRSSPSRDFIPAFRENAHNVALRFKLSTAALESEPSATDVCTTQ